MRTRRTLDDAWQDMWFVIRRDWDFMCDWFGFAPDRRIYRVPDDIC